MNNPKIRVITASGAIEYHSASVTSYEIGYETNGVTTTRIKQSMRTPDDGFAVFTYKNPRKIEVDYQE